jgi:hypothetical protein
MAKKTHNRFTLLAPDLASPRIVPAIDKALEENLRERTELIRLREMAVERHGDSATAPREQAGKASTKVSTDLRNDQKNKHEDFDLSIASLISRYKTDGDFGYGKLRFRTRQHYDSLLRRIEKDMGSELIRDIDGGRIFRAHKAWTASGASMAQALVVMLRGLFSYGANVLKNKDCRELKFTISEMKFPTVKGQSEPLTAEQAAAIINQAHALGFDSLALAQAFQSECGLGQRDVIGEWVPEREPGETDLHHEGQKWLRGIRWNEIGKDLILRHPRSRDGKILEIKLSESRVLMKELARYSDKQGTSGPIIIMEGTELPYFSWNFRSLWREVADAAGVPKNIKNMDSTRSDDD